MGNRSDPADRPLRDGNEHLVIDPVKPRVAAAMLGRACLVRCPRCGRGPVLQHWWKLRDTCGSCHQLLERGERDYFVGAMMFNLAAAELLFTVIFVSALVASWPNVNWGVLQIALPVGMVLAPVLLYPVSKLLWLAFDLMLRPDRAAGATANRS